MQEKTDLLMGGPGRIQQPLESSSVVVVNHRYNLETGETLSVSKNLPGEQQNPNHFGLQMHKSERPRESSHIQTRSHIHTKSGFSFPLFLTVSPFLPQTVSTSVSIVKNLCTRETMTRRLG